MVPQSLLSTIAAPISLLESFTGSFRQSSEFVQLDTLVNETDSSGYDFQYPNVPLDRIDRFQVYRVGHAMWYDGRFQGNDRLPCMQRLRD